MKPSEAHLWYSSRRELLPASGRNRLSLSSFTRALASRNARRLWTRGNSNGQLTTPSDHSAEWTRSRFATPSVSEGGARSPLANGRRNSALATRDRRLV